MFKIQLEGGPQFDCSSNDTLLRAGLRAGLAMAYECNSGACGACKVEVVSGELVTTWSEAPALHERDRARNRVLACQAQPRSDCTVKARLRDTCRPHHRPMRFDATLLRTRDLTSDMGEFTFRTQGNPHFLPGQYAMLQLPGVTGLRAYSMSNVDDGDGLWEFQVRRTPQGTATSVMFDRLAVGTQIEIDGPYGLAYLRTDSARDVLCIGGGSGLSAVLSVARGAVREVALADRRIHFFYGARGPRDVCGQDLLEALPGYGTRIEFTAAISMPQLDTDGLWRGKTGYIHEVVRDSMGDRLADFEIYFAGPPAMAQAVQTMLAEQKVPHTQVHFDNFY